MVDILRKSVRGRSRALIQVVVMVIAILIIAVPLIPILFGGGSGPQSNDLQERQAVVNEYFQENGIVPILEGSPSKGAEDARIFLIEFSDFQCPFCAGVHPTVQQFMEQYGDRVQLVYKHLPIIQIHPEALPAARASWAAEQQGKFWEFHDAMFENQARLGEEFYLEVAESLDLDIDQFNEDRSSTTSRQAIEEDLAVARDLGIQSTPTFLMNNLLIPGAVPLEGFELTLQQIQASDTTR